MPDITNKEFRKEILSIVESARNNPTNIYLDVDFERIPKQHKLFTLVEEYEKTWGITRFVGKFGFGKAAKLVEEFNTVGLNQQDVYDSYLKKLSISLNESLPVQNTIKPEFLTQDHVSPNVGEYGSVPAALAGSVPEQVYGQAPTLPNRTHEYANPTPQQPTNEYGAAPKPINSQYDKVPTPIYDKVPPISQYGSVKDLVEPIITEADKKAFFAAVHNGNREVFDEMINTMPDLAKARDEKGYTPLHWVQNKEMAALLIEKGADVNAAANDHTLPRYWARQSGNEDLLKYFNEVEGKPGKFETMVGKRSQSGTSGLQK